MTKTDPTHTSKACSDSLNAIGDALYAIGGKWKLRIIVVLFEGKCRFNDLQRSIPGISSKMLASELKELELNGFVKREVFTGIPVTVEYCLTEYSNTLQDVLQALSAWGFMHREKIKNDMQREDMKHIAGNS